MKHLFADLAATSRRRKSLIGIALLWFLLWLAATAPAALLSSVLHRWVPALQLDAVEGTVWNGSAGRAYWHVGNRAIALGRLDWQVRAWSLLWLHPSAHITANWGDQLIDTHIRISPLGTLSLRDARAVVPATLLQVWAPVPARGSIGLDLSLLDVARSKLRDVEGRIEWRGANWQWGQRWLTLGDYRIDLVSADANSVVGKLEGKGDVAGHGELKIDLAKHQYHIDAKLMASRGLPQGFRDSLTFMLGAKSVENPTGGAGAPLQLIVQRQGGW